MRFYEYEAKEVLKKYSIPLPKNIFVQNSDSAFKAALDISAEVVIKSQVLSGGRMKAGGIDFANSPEEVKIKSQKILELDINCLLPIGVLIEEKKNITQEYFAAVTYDGRAKKPVIIFSDMGGIDIEEVANSHPEHLSRTHFSACLLYTSPSPRDRG